MTPIDQAWLGKIADQGWRGVEDELSARLGSPPSPGPVETDPASVARFYEQANYLMRAGYDVQFKAGPGCRAIYCLIHTGGLSRAMVAIQSGPNMAMALARAMDKAGFLQTFNQLNARG